MDARAASPSAQPVRTAGVDGLRSGIIGPGFIGEVHARAVRAAGGVVAAVAGSSPERAAAAAERFGAAWGAPSAEALVESHEVDVVHICTPNHAHAALADLALRAGKPVICEKPLATTVDEARRLVAAADEAGVVATVPFVYRFYATVREVRARIAAEEAGSLWLLHGSYLQDWLAASDATNWRMDPALGGISRAFADIGVHWCDLMEFVTGHRIVSLTAVTGQAFSERRGDDGSPDTVGTEDGAAVLFTTDLGARGSLVVSQVSPGRKNRLWFSFDGSRASYVFDQESPDSLWVGGQTESRIIARGPDTLSAAGARYAQLPAGHPQGYQDSFNAFVADTFAAIAGRPPDGLPGFADGLRAAVLSQAVVDSARQRAWVEVAV
ncbi:Gfo/Idh/MocA family protein [Arthrobacter sp. Marseille-P9274]|uniref:Gfo/Idh/MocA family protein n=1 Tax=Arthrobacter sp. Marseille-P9274 TaxID=2866572 RepID=UPI0021C80266|nr:Gfo/Idh/MocA family oxidoreductase [Arthrobacter sp. Marseille-P9274]